MPSLTRRMRAAARGLVTFGPRYIVSIMAEGSKDKVKNVETDWGKFYFRRGNSDVSVYRQVFKAREYELSRYPQFAKIQRRYEEIIAEGARPIIIDAGANNGVSAVWFSLSYPKAVIIAVEPDPDNAKLCRLNTAQMNNVLVVEAAIGSTPGSVDISSDDKAWAVQSTRVSGGAIDIVTAPELFKLAGADARPFMCKIDIEGFEQDLFASNIDWLDDLAVVIIEPHDWMPSTPKSSITFQKALSGWGEVLISGENLVYVNGNLADA